MRGRRLLLGAAAAWSALGCASDAPTAVDASRERGAALSVNGAGGTVDFSYGGEEARELRYGLLRSFREDQPIARGRGNAILLRAFVVGADSFHYALAYDERMSPPKFSVLLKNGRPQALIRYEWEKRGSRWQSQAAQLTFWNAKGEPVLQGGVRAEPGALREISAVVERVTYAVLARAVRSAHAQLYFHECFSEYMELAAAAAGLAAVIGAPDPTMLTKLLIITLTSAYAKAVYRLDLCIDAQRELHDKPHEGDGGGDTPEGAEGGGAGGGGGGGDPGLLELLKKLMEDCENAEVPCMSISS